MYRKGDIVFSLILVPTHVGTPRLLPLYVYKMYSAIGKKIRLNSMSPFLYLFIDTRLNPFLQPFPGINNLKSIVPVYIDNLCYPRIQNHPLTHHARL